MAAERESPEGTGSRKSFRLPPELDRGPLKQDDLSFDVEQEVARLRAAESSRTNDTSLGVRQ